MKILVLAIALFSSLLSFGQKMKSAVAPFDHKDVNVISVTFKDEDVNPFIENLKKEFGPGEKYNDSGDGYQGMRWFGLQQPDWNNKRIIVRLYKVPANNNKMIILINCMNEAGDDLLEADGQFEPDIRKYFKKKLNF